MALRAGIDMDGQSWAPDSIGKYSFACGVNSKAIGEGSIALGSAAYARRNYVVAIGAYARCEYPGQWGVAVGAGARSVGGNGTAVGTLSAAGSSATAIGDSAVALGYKSIAIGGRVKAPGDLSVAIGNGAHATNTRSFTIGTGHFGLSLEPLVNNTANSLLVGFDAVPLLFASGDDGSCSQVVTTDGSVSAPRVRMRRSTLPDLR
jgi:autotransporter adhesin